MVKDRIGFIGIGRMGLPMCANLLRKGFAVTTYDRCREPLQKSAALGARPAASIAELVALSDIVLLMLPGPSQVMEAALGEQGVIPNARPGMLLIDMSTVDPSTTDALAAASAKVGMAMMDAAVGRLAEGAERGESLFMVGADAADLGRARPLLEAMGNRIHHAGPPGAGSRTKLIIHLLAIVSCQMNAEAFTLAKSFGLDLSRLLDLIHGTTATNGQMRLRYPKKVFAGDMEPGFTTRLANTDLALALAAARQAGVETPVAQTASELVVMACEAGYGDKDFSALLDHWCERAGIERLRLPVATELPS